jgi:elongation factor G
VFIANGFLDAWEVFGEDHFLEVARSACDFVLNDLNRKRAQVNGVEAERERQVVRAKVPLAEMFGYSTDLRSATQGRATFTMQFVEFAEVPAKKAETIIHKIRGV